MAGIFSSVSAVLVSAVGAVVVLDTGDVMAASVGGDEVCSSGDVPLMTGGTFSSVAAGLGSAVSAVVIGAVAVVSSVRVVVAVCAAGSATSQVSSCFTFTGGRAIPLLPSTLVGVGGTSSATPSVFGCSLEMADTAPLFGASGASMVDAGGDTSVPPAPSFSGSFSPPAAGVVSDVAAAAPNGGPGAGSASFFSGNASCAVLCVPVDSGCVAGTGLEDSVAPDSGEALPMGGSCGGFASTCGGGEDCAVAAEGWLGCCWALVGSAASCLFFLPRLKMPLKTRLTMLPASGAEGVNASQRSVVIFAVYEGSGYIRTPGMLMGGAPECESSLKRRGGHPVRRRRLSPHSRPGEKGNWRASIKVK